MRHGRNIFDYADFHTSGNNSADCGFATSTGTLDPNFDFLHAKQLGFLGSIAGDNLAA